MYTRVSTTSSPPATLIARSNYIILPTMPLSEDIVTSRHRFTSYGPASVTINEVVYRQSLVLTALFGERGIGLEVMDNGALCRTFNILVAEDRAVTAAVILST